MERRPRPVSSNGLSRVERARAGDKAAFTALLQESDSRMRALAYRVLGSTDETHDALQDAYMKAYRGIVSFDGASAFSTWLYTIVYRTCLDHISARQRRRSLDQRAAGDVPVVQDHAERHAEVDALARALDDLPPDQVAALMLIDRDELPYQDAAQILGVAEGTLSSRVSRARTRVQASLDERDQPAADEGGRS